MEYLMSGKHDTQMPKMKESMLCRNDDDNVIPDAIITHTHTLIYVWNEIQRRQECMWTKRLDANINAHC